MLETKRQWPAIVIVGPTAAGKTAVAIALAQKIGAEILSADSRQFYYWLDIGTAKPSPRERARVPHHFVDILPPEADYSAGEFSRQARQRIADLRHEGKNAVVVGGSGMYIQALLDGFFEPQARDKALQRQLKRRARERGSEALYAKLQRIDPERAAQLHPNDAHRIVRALEVFYATGQKFSDLQRQPRVPADFDFRQFGLAWPREHLYARIEQRVEEMLQQGLEREVRALLARGISPETNALQTVGYKEMIQYIRGEIDFDEAVQQIKQHTRNYAKRQLTWFRKDPRIRWIEVQPGDTPEQIAEGILHML